jgi:hypothetical protein
MDDLEPGVGFTPGPPFIFAAPGFGKTMLGFALSCIDIINN